MIGLRPSGRKTNVHWKSRPADGDPVVMIQITALLAVAVLGLAACGSSSDNSSSTGSSPSASPGGGHGSGASKTAETTAASTGGSGEGQLPVGANLFPPEGGTGKARSDGEGEVKKHAP